MRLYYIANVRLPTEKAHGLQIMKMCEAFARQGAEVILVVPWRFNPFKKDPFEYYGIDKNFKIIKIPSIDLVKFGKIGFWVQSLSFSKLAQIYVLFGNADIIYSRETFPLFWLSFYKKNIFWEAHRGELNFMVKRLLKKCRGIVAITQGLKNFYAEKSASQNKILVAPDGVDLKEFDILISKEEARKKFDLPLDKKIILYTGHLYGWKGAGVLLEMAKQFSISNFHFSKDLLFVFVGGMEEDIEKFKSQSVSWRTNSKNIIIVGHRPHQEIPYWLKSADVLVLPNSAKEKISRFYTSPLKLFEYMASGIPIVASDLPSVREILNDPSAASGQANAVLVKPDNPESLAEGIKKVLGNLDLAEKISAQALIDVQNYTWDKRAERILKFINSC